jgi:sialidase-1
MLRAVQTSLVATSVLATLVASAHAQEYKGEIWIHPRAQKLPTDQMGPFVRLGIGCVAAVRDNRLVISKDDGKTWMSRRLIRNTERFQDTGGPGSCALFRTREGVLVHAFVNMKEYAFKWDYENNSAVGPLPDCSLPLYVTRSLDDGRTWEEPRLLQDGWCGYVGQMIQTRSGRLVLVSERAMPNPGRHVSMTYVSDDRGATWTRSNLLDDLYGGGPGDHAGLVEATIVELKDGRIWMLIRTYSGVHWQAWSADEGLTWTNVGPSEIENTGSPSILLRLQSGRIMLVWNRYPPDRPKDIGRREELSVAFSEDEGQTWTEPVVVARNRTPEGGNPVEYRIAYPDVYEHNPGEIWITTGQGLLRMKLFERDFLAGPGR